MSTGSIGYTSGALYKRHKVSTYTPGSKYARFGRFGLLNQRNMNSMNRQAVAGYNDSFAIAGPNMFAQKAIESQGLSEIAAQKLVQRVKAEMEALADRSSSLSLANGGTGGSTSKGSTVDKSA